MAISTLRLNRARAFYLSMTTRREPAPIGKGQCILSLQQRTSSGFIGFAFHWQRSAGGDARRSGSSDIDTAAPADTIASYTFNFGDGSAPVTQSNPTITHTYAAGNYRATVQVTDSRGKQSTNSAGVNLEVADPQPPAAPSNLAVTATTANSISLSWTDNADTETGFKLERCQNANCTNFQQLPAFGANITSFTDSGLKANATYRYRLRAFNAAGNSAYSNIVTGRARK